MPNTTVTTGPAWFLGANSHTAATLRQMVRAVCGNTRFVDDEASLKVTQVATSSTLSIAAGGCVIMGSDAVGGYAAVNASARTTTITGDAGGQRTDLFVIQIADVDQGGATNEWQMVRVEGSVGGGTPATPALSIPLATVVVPQSYSTGALTITDLRRTRRQMAGGITSTTSSALPGSPAEADLRYETDTDRIYYHTGTTWQLVSAGRQASFEVVRGVQTTVANAIWTQVNWGSEGWDTDNMWASGVYVTVPSNLYGLWLITGAVDFDTNSTGARSLGIELDSSGTPWGGSTPDRVLQRVASIANFETTLSGSVIVSISASFPRISMPVWQNSSASLFYNSARMQGVYLGLT